jgi:hypothetical protein
MDKDFRTLAGLSADEAVAYVMENDISDLLDQADVVREPRLATMVSTVTVGLDTHCVLEAAAAERAISVTTLMLRIIEEWVRANRKDPER